MKGNFKKVLPLAILVALSVTALVGCPQPGNSLCVVNNSGTELIILNVHPYEEGVSINRILWGPNQLPGPLTSMPGTSGCDNTYCVTQVPTGLYDLRAVFNTPAAGTVAGNLEIYRFKVPFGPASWQWIFTLEDVPNSTSSIIVDQLKQQ